MRQCDGGRKRINADIYVLAGVKTEKVLKLMESENPSSKSENSKDCCLGGDYGTWDIVIHHVEDVHFNTFSNNKPIVKS